MKKQFSVTMITNFAGKYQEDKYLEILILSLH